jgi:hypothetical protein
MDLVLVLMMTVVVLAMEASEHRGDINNVTNKTSTGTIQTVTVTEEVGVVVVLGTKNHLWGFQSKPTNGGCYENRLGNEAFLTCGARHPLKYSMSKILVTKILNSFDFDDLVGKFCLKKDSTHSAYLCTQFGRR